MEAFYIGMNSFKILGNKVAEFVVDRRLRLDCVDDGIEYATVVSSALAGDYTEVVVDESCLTVNLITVYYSVVCPGSMGNMSNHYHSSAEGDGGFIPNSFVGLEDVVSTYSGTDGYFAVSTGSGIQFEEVQVDKSFLELTDTVATYEATEGYFAKSTGSGIVFEYVSGGVGIDFSNGVISLDSATTVPPDVTGFEANWNDVTRNVNLNWDQVIMPNEGYYEIRELSSEGLGPIEYVREARSVIFSASSTWGGGYAGLRQIDFLMNGIKITVDSTNCTIYRSTTEHGHLEYCKYAFYTNTSKTGDSSSNGYLKASLFVIVFDEVKQFNRIVVNNYHDYGAATTNGVKDIKIYTTLDELNGTSGSEYYYYSYYNYDPNFEDNTVLIFDGTLAQHVAADVVDDQIISLIELTPEWEFGASIVNTLVNSADVPIPNSFGGNKWYFIKALSTYGSYSDNAATIIPSIAILSGEPYEKSFLDLTDTPEIYGNTEGYFAKSTGSGIQFEEVQVDKSFLELTDTPTTYSGTEGYFAKSTGSGIVFEDCLFPVITAYADPMYTTEGNITDIYISSGSNTIFEKVREATTSSGVIVAKSIIIDIADNWGDGSYLGLRSVEFKKDGSLITPAVTGSNTMCYSTTEHSSPVYSADFVFDTTLSKAAGFVNDDENTSWVCLTSYVTNQRVICVFEAPVGFDEVVVNNYHNNGANTDRGAKNVKIYSSTDAIISTVYSETISNSELIFDGQLVQHPAAAAADDQTLLISGGSVVQDPGWDVVLETKNNFTELNDTPLTLSGTEGLYAKSTGSGVVFDEVKLDKSFLDLTDTETTVDTR